MVQAGAVETGGRDPHQQFVPTRLRVVLLGRCG
jgi:hypothetical protein